MAYSYIRDYMVSDVLYSGVPQYIVISVRTEYRYKEIFDALPTPAEANEALGYTDLPLYLNATFNNMPNLIASPFIHKEIKSVANAFKNCANLYCPPSLPKAIHCYDAFHSSGIVIAPTIPKEADSCTAFCAESPNLRTPASIPASVTEIRRIYGDCPNLSGEFIMRPSSMNSYWYQLALENTVEPITIYGDRSLCEAIAATANNGNASWQPWYDPVPAVTNRGQGSYTTAEDMTRMVRNGCLAVDSYAPGRMVYNRGDIVREDEWEALVEAAQTIDPTVTMSTHYTNLNKIEKAFDDAL